MQCFKAAFGAVVVAAAVSGAVGAECLICDELVVVDAARAACFLDHHDTILAAIDADPEGRRNVDLDACAHDGTALAERGGLLTMPRVGETARLASKSVFLLDRQGAECLAELIAAHPSPLNPSTTFDLLESCMP